MKLTKHQLSVLLNNASTEVKVGKDVTPGRFEVVIADHPYKAKFYTDGTLGDFKLANYKVDFMVNEVIKRKGTVDAKDLERLQTIASEVERVQHLMLTLAYPSA